MSNPFEMTPAQRECPHENFGANVRVHRLVDTGHILCEIEVGCATCGLPFSFVGPAMGLLMTGPAVGPDRTELRIPIEPGPTALAMGGEMLFEVPQRARES